MQLTARSSKIMVSADGTGIVSQAGGLLLVQTLRATGLDRGLDAALERWRQPRAAHSPGKIITGLAVAVALGGDCLADVAMLRAQPELFGPAASDPVVSRLVTRLAADVPRVLKAIRAARAAARQRAWELAGDAAPGADGGLVTVDSLSTGAHQAAPRARHWLHRHADRRAIPRRARSSACHHHLPASLGQGAHDRVTDEEYRSTLARRPYDLRHACLSTWLNGGVAATQVAEWAGHSVEMLLRVYARCLDGQDEIAKRRIVAALDDVKK